MKTKVKILTDPMDEVMNRHENAAKVDMRKVASPLRAELKSKGLVAKVVIGKPSTDESNINVMIGNHTVSLSRSDYGGGITMSSSTSAQGPSLGYGYFSLDGSGPGKRATAKDYKNLAGDIADRIEANHKRNMKALNLPTTSTGAVASR